MAEISHTAFVSVVRAGSRHVLFHSGTGERVDMQKDGVVAEDANGMAYFAPAAVDSVCTWANTVFSKSLHMGAGTEGTFILDKASNTKDFVVDLEGSFDSHVVKLAGVTTEIYLYKLSPCPSPHPCVMWALPQLQNFLGHGKNVRWATRNVDAWQRLLSDFGLGNFRLRRSRKSLAGQANFHCVEVDAEHFFGCGPEFAMSSAGLLAVVLSLCNSHTKHDTDVSRNLAATLLQGVLEKAMAGEQDFVLGDVSDHCSFSVSVSKGVVIHGSLKHTAGYKFLANAVLTETISLTDFLGAVFRIAESSRRHADTRLLAKRVVALTCEAVESIIEFQTSSGTFLDHDVDMLVLPMLRPGQRARRISNAVKVQLCRAVADTQGIKRPANFAAAEALVCKKRGLDTSSCISPSAASNFTADTMMLYWATARKCTAHDKHVSLCLDGLRAGGEEILLIAYWSPRINRSCWLPPQVNTEKH